MADKSKNRASIDKKRYRRTLRFFAGVFISFVTWEIILRRVVGARVVRKNRPQRLRRYAREFRHLAVEMGGVLIKLGQFFSARVDVLPVEITHELAGLQDEVPAADFEAVRPLIEREIGPLDRTFSWFDERAHAAASLGQVYRGRLTNGERVVLKVQRPGIHDLVATDLEALGVVAGWTMRFGPIRRRANVPALVEEFAATLWEELDYVAEAENAQRFGEMFADNHEVYVPAVYSDLSTACVLFLEDVTCIKITDHAAIDAAGVDRHEVALRLFRLYMTQIFDHRFFHADPHPGNLFVYPLPREDDAAQEESRPFYLVFVDFGMVGRITDNVLAGMREALLAVGTKDMRRLVKAYQIMGVLLPHADVDRIAMAEQKIFDRVWGMNMRQMATVGYQEMREFAREFSDVLYELPFQVPQNIIYVGRAAGIVSGMCTSLDPEFNPWTAIAPYARKMVEEELRLQSGTILEQLVSLGRVLLKLPRLAEGIIEKMERGELQLQAASGAAGQSNPGLDNAVRQVANALVFATLVAAGTVLLLNGERAFGWFGYGLAGVSLLLFFWRGRG
jgi:predicted unusual protein kinase regulating ubiquinone biosynthesis (AarF/ABC1/UbiB family)